MKNWWLIAGGIAIGSGVSDLVNNAKGSYSPVSKSVIAFELIGGAILTVVAINYMDK